MKYVAPIRKELGIRTVFNILGPLSNPAGANMELMGVYEQELVEPLAQVMAKLGVVRGMVVYGQDKLDEISMSAPTSICEIRDGWFQSYEITSGAVRIYTVREVRAHGRHTGGKRADHERYPFGKRARGKEMCRVPECGSCDLHCRQSRVN